MTGSDDLKTVALHDRHTELGARMVPFAGFSMPLQYSGIKEEHHAVRNRVGLFDVSHMGRMEVRGEDAIAAVDRLMTNDVERLVDGKALYTVMCNERGGIIDDLVIYRLHEQRLLLCVNAANRQRDRDHIEEHLEGEAKLVDRSDETTQLALQGPEATSVLAGLTDFDLDELKFFRCAEMKVAGVHTLVGRTGYTGEDGFELYFSASSAPTLFDAFLAWDNPAVTPCGLGCRDTLRLEAGLLLHGQDIHEETNPLEAGLGWLVKFDSQRDFLGAAPLREIKERGVKRKLRGFRLRDRGVLRPGYPIELQGRQIGEMTSGSYSPTLEASIGLGYIDAASADASQVDVVIRGRARRADVVDPRFYKRPR